MLQDTRELWWAFFAALLVTLVYGLAVIFLQGIPGASGLFGHSLGILGFGLMLMTETLYSLRKRSRRAWGGSMAGWLRFHIFTGLVGPYMVLLHSSWKFSGLAGIVLLLTAFMVISGFVGRYIYTAVPRTNQGVEVEASEIQAQIAAVEAELLRLRNLRREPAGRGPAQVQPRVVPASVQVSPGRVQTAGRVQAAAPASKGYGLVLGRAINDLGDRLEDWGAWLSEKGKRGDPARAYQRELSRLQNRKRVLQRQIASLVMARRLLSLWHTVHIPLGIVLFASALVHIVAAIYFATLLR